LYFTRKLSLAPCYSSLFSVEFPLLWNVVSTREWDFTAQQFWWSWVSAHSEGTLLTMQCKWTTNRFILSTLQRKRPMSR